MKLDIINSFSPHTKIHYKLHARSHVTLAVFDALGRIIATLVDEVEERGEKSVNFNTNGLAYGEYWYQLVIKTARNRQSKSYTQTKKLLLQK